MSLTIFKEIKKYLWRRLPHSYAYITAQHLPIVQIIAAKCQDISFSGLLDNSKPHKTCTLYNTKSWLLLYCSCCIQGSTITMFFCSYLNIRFSGFHKFFISLAVWKYSSFLKLTSHSVSYLFPKHLFFSRQFFSFLLYSTTTNWETSSLLVFSKTFFRAWTCY